MGSRNGKSEETTRCLDPSEMVNEDDDENIISAPTLKDDKADRIAKIKPGLYGWGKFTPKWLQFFNKPYCLHGCFCFTVFSLTLAGSLMPAIADTLEKRFHLNSVRSGLMFSMYDIASLTVVMIVCHFGERSHKGKWIGIGALVFGTGSLIVTIPHYIAEKYNPSSVDYYHNATCPANYPRDICGADSAPDQGVSTSYYIFLAGQAVRGLGGTCFALMISYVDENVPQRSSPWYIAVISVVGLVAMVIGTVSAGEFLHLYGEFDRVPKDKWPARDDPSWYGCWWLGYWIAGACAFVVAIPILGFPKELPSKIKAREQDREQAHVDQPDDQAVDEYFHEEIGSGIREQWNHIKKMTMSLIKNPVFTFFTLRAIVDTMYAAGWGPYFPKYLQNMYGMDPGYSAMIGGGITVGSVMTGTLAGGWIIKKFNWKVRGVLTFGFVFTVIGSFLGLSIMYLCGTKPIAGANVDYAGRTISTKDNNLNDECNMNCSCLTSDYIPVCFQEGDITYYNPCFAGCKGALKEDGVVKYTDCECVKHHFSSIALNYTVVTGECPQGGYCIKQRNWFIAFWALGCLIFGMTGMPLCQAFLRAVPFSQRTFALGLQSIPLRLLGTVPGPMLMGLMFDASCILWRKNCGKSQSCLRYDNEVIMWLALYTGIAQRIFSGAMLFCAIVFYRPPKKKKQQEGTGVDSNANIPPEKLHWRRQILEEYADSSIFDIVWRRVKNWLGCSAKRLKGTDENAALLQYQNPEYHRRYLTFMHN